MSIKISKSKKDLDVFVWFWFGPISYYFNSFVFHLYLLGWRNIAWKLNLILIKPIFFEIVKKTMFFLILQKSIKWY